MKRTTPNPFTKADEHRPHPVSPDERLYLLSQAKLFLTQAAAGLDDTAATCECCGLLKKTNFDEAIAKEDLLGAITRVGRAQGRLMPHDHKAR